MSLIWSGGAVGRRWAAPGMFAERMLLPWEEDARLSFALSLPWGALPCLGVPQGGSSRWVSMTYAATRGFSLGLSSLQQHFLLSAVPFGHAHRRVYKKSLCKLHPAPPSPVAGCHALGSRGCPEMGFAPLGFALRSPPLSPLLGDAGAAAPVLSPTQQCSGHWLCHRWAPRMIISMWLAYIAARKGIGAPFPSAGAPVSGWGGQEAVLVALGALRQVFPPPRAPAGTRGLSGHLSSRVSLR